MASLAIWHVYQCPLCNLTFYQWPFLEFLPFTYLLSGHFTRDIFYFKVFYSPIFSSDLFVTWHFYQWRFVISRFQWVFLVSDIFILSEAFLLCDICTSDLLSSNIFPSRTFSYPTLLLVAFLLCDIFISDILLTDISPMAFLLWSEILNSSRFVISHFSSGILLSDILPMAFLISDIFTRVLLVILHFFLVQWYFVICHSD